MAPARKIPLPIAPGLVISKTEYEAQGRYIDADHVRFVDGQPEKIGGWEQWNLPGDEITSVCRTALFWQDFSYNTWFAFGTSSRLWVFDQDKARTNITPYESTGTLTNPFSTGAGIADVTVADTAHGVVAGQYVNFSGASAVGGITVDGEYQVAYVADANTYAVLNDPVAVSTAGPGGGTVDYAYELEAGNVDVTLGGGWGLGRYGEGTYGTERSSVTYAQLPRIWSLDRYGQYLLALPTGGTVYMWQLDVADRAEAVANAPTGLYMFVTSERMIVVLGSDGDFMRLAWCDDDDPTIWTPASTNTANVRKLQEGSRLICGARLAQGVNMLWTDTAIYLMQFTGSNNVYSTRIVGTNCGIIGATAFVVVDGIAYWMGPNKFYLYNGVVSQIPRSDEIEPIFAAINTIQRFKVSCFYNPAFREVWWLYPSLESEEPDQYVMVCLDDWSWAFGTMERTAMGTRTLMGENVLLGVDTSGVIYQHEIGKDADGEALNWYIESGFFDLESGNVGLNIDGFIPDFYRQTGTINLVWTSRDLPQDGSALETFTSTLPEGLDVRDLYHYGRQCKFRMSQSNETGGDFRFGAHRIEVSGQQSKRQK